jgi:hypothetical protein
MYFKQPGHGLAPHFAVSLHAVFVTLQSVCHVPWHGTICSTCSLRFVNEVQPGRPSFDVHVGWDEHHIFIVEARWYFEMTCIPEHPLIGAVAAYRQYCRRQQAAQPTEASGSIVRNLSVRQGG